MVNWNISIKNAPHNKLAEVSRGRGMKDKGGGGNVKKIREGKGWRRGEGIRTHQENKKGSQDSGSMILMSSMLEKGSEVRDGTSVEIKMRENKKGRRVLGNMDQNCKALQLVK